MAYIPNENEITPGQRIPDFALPAAGGGTLRLSDYRNRANLVLIFTGPAEEAEIGALIDELERSRPRLEAEDGEAVLVVPYGLEAVERMAESLEARLPLVADEGAMAHRKFGAANSDGSLAFMIYVTDQFGEVYNCTRAEMLNEIPRVVQDAYEWLVFIELQCPE